MAISTDSSIEFLGTQDKISATSTSAITNGSYSGSSDVISGNWTNDDDALYAKIIMEWQYASGTISSGARFTVFARLMNIQGTEDMNQPDANFEHYFLGNIPVDEGLGTSTNEFTRPIIVRLPNLVTSQVYQFYFKNVTGVTVSAGWDAWITPSAAGPHG